MHFEAQNKMDINPEKQVQHKEVKITLIIFLNISASSNNFWEHCSCVPPLFAPMWLGLLRESG